MRNTDVLVIGGGQAGLAVSACLTARGIEHVVLERGRVAERWRSERWESLRLLTPNWQSRLPGFRYDGDDPDGYMTMTEVIEYLERYARSFDAPVEGHTTVLSVEQAGARFLVRTDRGDWSAAAVAIATGHCDEPFVPRLADALAPDLVQLVPSRYRNPQQLPSGGVLIVGASASGVQLADEIHASGRPVTLAVGSHIRLPRLYRGKDILWWLDGLGVFDETPDQAFDIERSRRQPSYQLVGRPDHATLDLPLLQRRGVRLTGRVIGIDGARVSFDDDLVASVIAADARLAQLLARVDAFIASSKYAAPEPEPFRPFLWPDPAPTRLDLHQEGIDTVIWATGFTRNYRWLKVPVLDARGEIVHQGGITPVAGLYVVGLRFQRRRNSNFIDGVRHDAFAVAEHIAALLKAAA